MRFAGWRRLSSVTDVLAVARSLQEVKAPGWRLERTIPSRAVNERSGRGEEAGLDADAEELETLGVDPATVEFSINRRPSNQPATVRAMSTSPCRALASFAQREHRIKSHIAGDRDWHESGGVGEMRLGLTLR